MSQSQGNKFSEKLDELGLRSEAVALAVNRSTRAVQSWRKGTYIPQLTPRETSKMCNLLGISVDDLADLFDEEEQA